MMFCFYVYSVWFMWPVLCSLKLVINVLKSVPRRQKVHRLSLCGKRDEAEWVISLRRADNAAVWLMIFKEAARTHIIITSVWNLRSHTGNCLVFFVCFFLTSLIMTPRFLFFLRTSGSLAATRRCPRMTFTWSKSASTKSGCTSSASSYRPSH